MFEVLLSVIIHKRCRSVLAVKDWTVKVRITLDQQRYS
jgi:hypothetical protein